MVKSNKSKKRQNRKRKGSAKTPARAKKIDASTAYDTCSEQLSPFGGVLPLVKFLVRLMAVMRQHAWKLCDLNYFRVCVDIDTTVETLFGNHQGGRKGHNTKNRGKKGYRPVLAFIEQTREYLIGSLRKGETITGKETARLIDKIKQCLPDIVNQVLIRADGEFQSWDSIHACILNGFDFIIANKRCHPVFDPMGWYRPKKRQPYEYNSCLYQPDRLGNASSLCGHAHSHRMYQ